VVRKRGRQEQLTRNNHHKVGLGALQSIITQNWMIIKTTIDQKRDQRRDQQGDQSKYKLVDFLPIQQIWPNTVLWYCCCMLCTAENGEEGSTKDTSGKEGICKGSEDTSPWHSSQCQCQGGMQEGNELKSRM
jgi:hypothetical protein